ncbi:MAG: hypothetical protein COB02_07500 [Candidatus Cloacimonadota bacterium]|nr:MAG: hypothetical protein COB02_07500 [Candidatus Cloacimonadota bacterium]
MKYLLFFLLFSSSSATNIEFSKSFSIHNHNDYKYIEIFDKNHNILQQITIGKNFSKIKKKHHKATFIQLPIKKIASLSTTHLFQLKQLNSLSKLNGIGFYQYLSDLNLKNKLKKQNVKEMGMPGQINFETVVFAKPQLLFSYHVPSDEDTIKKLSKIGIHTIYIHEYLESHPLAYAEWIKLFACFFEKEQEAESIFKKIKNRYLRLSKLLLKVKIKPSVFMNENYGGTWYMPNSQTFMAQLIKDAGGKYLFDNLSGTGSSKLSIETVIVKALKADYWLNPGQVISLNDLKQNDSRYSLFKAFKKKQIFNNNLRVLKHLPNNYFDEALSQPHLLLADLISIFHPQILKTQAIWYHRLK